MNKTQFMNRLYEHEQRLVQPDLKLVHQMRTIEYFFASVLPKFTDEQYDLFFIKIVERMDKIKEKLEKKS